MKTIWTLLGIFAAGTLNAQVMPKPAKEHAWLKALEGEWTTEGEAQGPPHQPPTKLTGSASGRSLGGFWTVLENRGEAFGAPFTGILTLGYDPETKRYVGTWIDSMTSTLWRYDGAVDAGGKILTLHAEGPCMQTGGTKKYEEKIEMQGPDRFLFTSAIEMDGKFQVFLKLTYARKTGR